MQGRIADACAEAGRQPDEVTLVVVTKFFPVSDVRVLAELGVRDVGENRYQEAVAKSEECADLDLRWHFMGRLQSNKAAAVGRWADVVQSLDRAKLVPRSGGGAEEREDRGPLEVLVQVNLDTDPEEARARGGAAPDDVPALAEAVAGDDGAPARRRDGGGAARGRPPRGLRTAARGVRGGARSGARGDVRLGRHERGSRSGDRVRCDTRARRRGDPRKQTNQRIA